ncbi:hypothetical protein SSX86_016200 [Deinandra increscens subsp. villosa]|uniref:WRKY domain-containing protein n=1 Tax=Deinandra increscens subsp. villosa TaxID=3103831 RepID=A0AAP0D1S3_9ASTR
MTDYMAETGGGGDPTTPPPPQRRLPSMIKLPQRSFLDTSAFGLISPGPMTLVSNYFSDYYPDTDLGTLSQLFTETLPILAAQDSTAPLVYNDSVSDCQKESKHHEKQNHKDLDTQPRNPKPESVVLISKPGNDGYKWRKYGQKQVKASLLPRSYYKCSQTNCPATKKVGHFLDGDISDIMYKGQHNHEPPPVRTQAKYGATMYQQGNRVVANDVVGDAVILKKRKMDLGSVDRPSSSPVVMVTEPKIVVQMRSEVDILDDGFKWRKYGQKVVKGNTYPRSYYRCAYAECKVRKHVERAYLDPKSVVTTYEGRHKHDTPVTAKVSSHNETNFKDKTMTLLQLKEEQISS